MNTVIFLNDLAKGLLPDERLILCGFPGDPNNAGPNAWRPRPWKPESAIPFHKNENAYVTVAAFKKASDGTYRRRTETFSAGLALMIDDVGTKVDRAIVEPMLPTYKIETSPGNEQWWYLLNEPERDAAKFDGLIRAFISGKLLGADPGMSGITRVGRLPGFLNGKKAYGGWTTKITQHPGARWTPQELLDGFGLKIIGRRVASKKLPSEEAIERNRMFTNVYKWLDQHQMLKKDEPDPSGWTEMTCPWVDQHTNGVDNGAAIREPALENDFYGAYRCHHGHCINKGWKDLTEWINEESIEELERAAK